jgi:hypothetical protein
LEFRPSHLAAQTIRLMAEIENVIEKHDGWPGAFVAADWTKPAAEPSICGDTLPYAAEEPGPTAPLRPTSVSVPKTSFHSHSARAAWWAGNRRGNQAGPLNWG